MEAPPRLELENDVCAILEVPKRQESILELAAESHHMSVSLEEEPSALINNFLHEYPIEVEAPHLLTAAQKVESQSSAKIQDQVKDKNPRKKKIRKKKRFKCDNNSPFHNYQKHLVIALKNLISFTNKQDLASQAEINVARQIWQVYQQGDIRSKKILHFIFNQINQYRLCQKQLQKYGFLGIYQIYGESLYRKAKEYLTKLAIQQIRQQNVKRYIWNSKIRDKNCFRNYIFSFKEELQKRFLKKRMIIE